jgi:succinoglycan biosynthesis transport protein ExoP
MSFNNLSTETFIVDYWKIIKKRKSFLIFFIVLVVVPTFYYSLKIKKVYEARALLLIERKAPQALSMNTAAITGIDTAGLKFYKTQYGLLKSRSLIKTVIQRLGLEEDEEFKSDPPLINLARIKNIVKSYLIEWNLLEQPEEDEVFKDPYTVVINTFLSRLSINPVRNSRLVAVVFRGHSPQLVTDIANVIGDMYILRNIELRSTAEQGAGQWLGSRVAETQKKLEESQMELQKFLEKENIIEFNEARQDISTQELVQINSHVTNSKAERVRLTTLMGQLEKLRNNPIEMLQSIPDRYKTATIGNINREYVALQEELSIKVKKLNRNHPTLLSLKGKMRSLEERIPREIDRLLKSIQVEFSTAVQTEQSLMEALDIQKEKVMELNKKLIKFNSLKVEVESNANVYQLLLRRLKETDISAKGIESNIRVVDRAEVPTRPIKPNLKMNVLISALLAAFGGIFLIFFFESQDKTLKTLEDVEAQIPFPVLGTIFLYKEASQSQWDEGFRIVRSNILNGIGDPPKKIIMMASTAPSEGKTTVLSNLAIGFAQLGQKVLVIDCDLRRSQLHKVFSLNESPGLSNYLLEDIPLTSIFQKPAAEDVYVISGGKAPSQSVELLSSKKFHDLLKTAKENFDIVFIDAPSVLSLSDSSVLAPVCDNIIYLIRSGKVDYRVVQRALKQLCYSVPSFNEDGEGQIKNMQLLPNIKAKVLGVVLNMVDSNNDQLIKYSQEYHRYINAQISKDGQMSA